MIKKIEKNDLIFIVTLIFGLLFMGIFIFTYPHLYDETFYLSVPFRFVQGDNIVQHEWHLTQFSSLFSYLPTWLWVKLTGSTDAIIVFSRCIYLAIHTVLASAIYMFFRKYKMWAVVAAMLFFTQTPYRFLAISYHSMFVAFLLLLTFCILSIYKKSSPAIYICTGLCFGCCCVANPLLCTIFPVYLLTCILWPHRSVLRKATDKLKGTIKNEKNSSKSKKKKSKIIEVVSENESYNSFFNKEAMLYIFIGTFVVAVIAVIYFFMTGGTISSLIRNIPNLLSNSEYSINLFKKFGISLSTFSDMTFKAPYILPLLYIVMLCDKRKREFSHRCIYLLVSIVLSVAYMVNIFYLNDDYAYAFELPIIIISTVCYILTEKKNKVLFNCMWIPCMIGSFFQYITANTYWATISLVFIINTVAGVFFIKDFYEEIREDLKANTEKSKGCLALGRALLCIIISIQFVVHGVAYIYGQVPVENAVKATSGPYSGLYMTEAQYTNYTKYLSDMDKIKEYNSEGDPVLVFSFNNWMYLYTDAPIANYTVCFNSTINSAYYKENPEKVPKYIYIDSLDYSNNHVPEILNEKIELVDKYFDFTKLVLSNGMLLTVTDCNFDLA